MVQRARRLYEISLMTAFYPKKDINDVLLSGIIKDDLEFIAEFKGTKIYKTNIGVLRLSETEDVLPVYISDRDENFTNLSKDKFIKINGSMRSSQYRDSNHIKRTRVYVQTREILEVHNELPSEWYDNSLELSGRLFREPILRKAKSNKNIDLCELVLEVHRGYNKYEHIPVIVWGTDAKYISKYSSGTEVSVEGRFQSRCFIRHINDGFENAVSYEVSARNIEVLNKGGN